MVGVTGRARARDVRRSVRMLMGPALFLTSTRGDFDRPCGSATLCISTWPRCICVYKMNHEQDSIREAEWKNALF
jgi:hypothetical protein